MKVVFPGDMLLDQQGQTMPIVGLDLYVVS